MAIIAEHRSKFAALHRQCWRLQMSETFPSGTKISKQTNKKISLILIRLQQNLPTLSHILQIFNHVSKFQGLKIFEHKGVHFSYSCCIAHHHHYNKRRLNIKFSKNWDTAVPTVIPIIYLAWHWLILSI